MKRLLLFLFLPSFTSIASEHEAKPKSMPEMLPTPRRTIGSGDLVQHKHGNPKAPGYRVIAVDGEYAFVQDLGDPKSRLALLLISLKHKEELEQLPFPKREITVGVLTPSDMYGFDLTTKNSEIYMLGLDDQRRSLAEWDKRLKPWIGKIVSVEHRIGGIEIGRKIGLLVNEIELKKGTP